MSNNSQLDVDFINFIAERVKNVNSPMILIELCREFKKKTGISSSDTTLFQRLQSIRDKMSEMDNIDIETKVKIMFALSSPVGNGFLIELKKEADVKLDEHHRIIEYKKNGNGLQLSGVHIVHARSNDIEIEKTMMEFLAQTSQNATSPITDTTFLKEFIFSKGCLKNEHNCHTRYNLLKQQIYLAPGFDEETKIKMMFVSNTKIYANILEELRKNTVVKVDEYQRIINYKANNGTLELKGKHQKCGLATRNEWTKPETDKLVKFVAEKSKQTIVPLSINHLCREFAEKNGFYRTTAAVGFNIRKRLLPKISKLDSFDIETRMRMLFALSVPVDKGFLKELQKKASVKIDEKRRIIKYTANDGSLELKGDHSNSAKQKLVYAQKKSNNGFSEFSENDEDEDDEEKDVNEEFSIPNTRSERLSKKRFLNNHFFSDSDDNSCESSEKVKKSKNKKTGKVTRKRRITSFSETSDEESEKEASRDDEESEEEYKEEEGESEARAKSSTTNSGRISKERHSDVDFSCEFEDVSLDSPESLEKESEEPVAKSSNSSSKAPIVKNQKRKIVENSSDATSSSSKSRKHGRDADTHNDTKTNTVASGTMQNDDKGVVYDGPGEPPRPIELPIKQELSHEKVKREEEEFKPDRSFLSNPNQNNMPDFAETEEIRRDDVEQSSENAEEMTSGKEFMKLLGCLVHTLDSPILAKLLSKIEKAIEKIGEGDHKIPTDEIARTLDSALFILNKNASRKPPDGEFTSLRDFFLILRNTLSFFRSSSLNNFQLKIKENIKKLDGQNEFILLDIIETVLGNVLLLVMP